MPDDFMEISLVFATYKRIDILRRTLASFECLTASPLKWELFVVDNAGDENTSAAVQDFSDKLPVHYSVEKNPGKNNALNSVLDRVQGELIVFTDDDIIATPDWLAQLWQGAQRWPDHSIFGGRILPDWPQGFPPPEIQSSFLINAYAIADWDFPEGEYDPKKVFGANMAVRREIFDRGWRFEGSVGPSQKANYVMGSETEFIFRLENAGHRPVYLPEALVYHQIRPDQMSLDWLKMRAFRAGRGTENNDGIGTNVKKLFGYPRYMIRRIVETFLPYVLAWLFFSKSKTQKAMQFYYVLGRLAQYREGGKI